MLRSLMVIIAGVDEAGRGPVIGPLVVAAVSFNEESIDELSHMGVRDSKALSSRKRESLVLEIMALCECYSYFDLQPWAIDIVVNRAKKLRRLNFLEAMAMAKTIRDLRPDRVYVDAADVIPERFRDDILRVLDWCPHLICEKKADAKYPVVSAASILAKVRRDSFIAELKVQYGDFGSGYPSDPKTVSFIRNWFQENDESLPCMRSSWRTVKRLRSKD